MTVLFKKHFQVCYLVDDAHQSMADFGEKYGISQWQVLDLKEMMGDEAPGRYITLAWIGDMMIELIEPIETVPSIYSGWQKESGQAARFHHLGFLVYSEEEFTAAKQQLVSQGFPIAAETDMGEILKSAQIDTTSALGHYYELIYLLGGEANQFFAGVPFN